MARRYWRTKYALSGGIQVSEGEPSPSYPDLIKFPGDWMHYRLGRDCFDNEADAIRDAEAKRVKKIASLERQIAKLKGLKFNG